jgi:hypothetical protein
VHPNDRPHADDVTDLRLITAVAKRPYGWHTIGEVHATSHIRCAVSVKGLLEAVPTEVVPRQVRAAGALVGLQGLAGVAFTVALLVRGATESGHGSNVFGEAGYYGVLAAGVIAVAVGLLLGRRWARTPAAVLQVLLIGVGWYAISGSGRVELGLPAVALCIGVLVLLFVAPSRAWAFGESVPDSGADPDSEAGTGKR